jgi:hypothetical protein
MKSAFRTTLTEVLQGGLMITIAAAAFYFVCPKYETHQSFRLNRITGEIVSIEAARRQTSPWVRLTAMFGFGENYLHRKSPGPVTQETEWTRIVDRSVPKTALISASQQGQESGPISSQR